MKNVKVLPLLHKYLPDIVAIALLVFSFMAAFGSLLINADDMTIWRGLGLEFLVAVFTMACGMVYLKIDNALVRDFRLMFYMALCEGAMLILYPILVPFF